MTPTWTEGPIRYEWRHEKGARLTEMFVPPHMPEAFPPGEGRWLELNHLAIPFVGRYSLTMTYADGQTFTYEMPDE